MHCGWFYLYVFLCWQWLFATYANIGDSWGMYIVELGFTIQMLMGYILVILFLCLFFRVQSTCWWQFTRRNLGLWAGTWLMEARYLLIRFISCISFKWFRSFNFITSNFIWLFFLVFFGRLFYIFHDLFFLSQICAGWSILFKLLDLMRIEYSRKEHDSIRYFSLLD